MKHTILSILLIIIIIYVIYKNSYSYKEYNTSYYTMVKDQKSGNRFNAFVIVNNRDNTKYITDMSTPVTTTTPTPSAGFGSMTTPTTSNTNDLKVQLLSSSQQGNAWNFDYYPTGQSTTVLIKNTYTKKVLCYKLFPDNITYIVTCNFEEVKNTNIFLWKLYVPNDQRDKSWPQISITTSDDRHIKVTNNNFLKIVNNNENRTFYVNT
jgi:hypothetical protein